MGTVPPDLETGGLAEIAARLADQEAEYTNVTDAPNCPETPELIIDSSSPDESLFIKKLEGTHDCGQKMPWARDDISAAEVECLIQWARDVASGNVGGAGPGTGGSTGTGGMGGAGGAQ
jgi:hypothetical protein